MPIHPNVRRCTHIQITGHRCGSPALKQEYFCYFHTRMIKGVQTRVDSEIHPVALIENAEAIQAALMHTIDAVLKGNLDNKRAHIVLKALNIAVRNSRNVRFHLHTDDMVREVPNYAEQYLSEHPELNPPLSKCGAGTPAREAASPCSADAPVREAAAKAGTDEQAQAAPPTAPPNPSPEKATAEPATKPAAARRQNAAHGASRGNQAENHQREFHQKECHSEQAQAFAERRPANKGSMHLPVDTDASQTPPAIPHSSDSGNGAAVTRHNPRERNHKKARTENTPPLTTRQSNHNHEIKKLEASIEGAMRGNWRDLRTVFNAVGLTPPKPSKHHR